MRVHLTLLILFSILFSCSTGKKALQRGDYSAATLQAVNRLRNNPNSSKATQAVKESYPLALSYFQSKIDNALNGDNSFKYSEAVNYYELMNRLSDEISRCPAALKIFPNLKYYTAELSQSKKLAAEEQYTAGLKNEAINTRLSWKEAFLNYQQADRFSPGYKDIRKRMEEARFNATLRVIVEQIRVAGNYQLTSDFFLNQIVENLTQNRPNQFVEYFSPKSAEKAGLKNPDQILRMSFDEFVIGQIHDKETIKELSRDSVEVGTVTLADGKKVKAYNTVKAKLKVNRRELISNGILDVTIIELPLKRVITQKKFPGEYVWFSEWGSFNGDERALNNKQLAICKQKPLDPPGPQDLFVGFTTPIFNQVTPFLKSFFQQY
jgi:tetratricopeptide (TPR) repeat protein